MPCWQGSGTVICKLKHLTLIFQQVLVHTAHPPQTQATSQGCGCLGGGDPHRRLDCKRHTCGVRLQYRVVETCTAAAHTYLHALPDRTWGIEQSKCLPEQQPASSLRSSVACGAAVMGARPMREVGQFSRVSAKTVSMVGRRANIATDQIATVPANLRMYKVRKEQTHCKKPAGAIA